MATKLTSAFKTQATEFFLNTSKKLILSNFDNNNKCNKTINIVDDINIIEISRNCFPEEDSKPYFEDYYVSFTTIIQNQKISSRFYLEWENNILNTELSLGNDFLFLITLRMLEFTDSIAFVV